jgi:hypothetical protein
MFSSSGEERETSTTMLGPSVSEQRMMLDLSKGPKRVGVSFPSPEDGNWSSFWNVLLSSVQNNGWWTKCTRPVILIIIVLHSAGLYQRQGDVSIGWTMQPKSVKVLCRPAYNIWAQSSRDLRRALSMPTRLLGPWVRIPLETWMSVKEEALWRANLLSKESYRLCIGLGENSNIYVYWLRRDRITQWSLRCY